MKTIDLGDCASLQLNDGFTPTPISGRDEWIAALRSGKYAQDVVALKSFKGYCCLGVKCELEGAFVWNGVEAYGAIAVYKGTCGLFSYGNLPAKAIITDARAGIIDSLAQANDYGLTFNQIATVIEHCFTERGTV